MKRLLALVLAVLLALLMFGCEKAPSSTTTTTAGTSADTADAASTPVAGSETTALDAFAKDNFNTTGYPIVNEPITVEIMAAYNNYQTTDFKDVMWVQKMEERTNIHVEWNLVTTSAREEQKNIMMASGDLPDALMKMSFSQTDLYKYGFQQEMLADISAYAALAPNFYGYLEESPTVKAALSYGEGSIYGFPYIVNVDASNTQRLHMNVAAMETAGIDQPTTTDEYYEVLKQMVQVDINGNGEADELGLAAGGIVNLENYFMGAFGLANRGRKYTYLDVNPDDGTLRSIYTSDRYKELLEYFNKLYTEGLIDPDLFTDAENSATAAGYAGQLVSFIAQNALFLNNEYRDQFDGLDAMLIGPHGDQFLTSNARLSSPGAFVISAESEYIAELVRWCDYNYCLDGIIEFFMGYEGVSYEITADGEYQYVESITSADSLDTAYSQYVLWAGGVNPSMSTPGYFYGAAVQPLPKSSMEKLQPYLIDTIWELVMVDEDYQNRISAITTDMDTCMKEWRANFVTGAVSLDQWDSFVSAMEACGLNEYLEIYTETFQGYGMLD